AVSTGGGLLAARAADGRSGRGRRDWRGSALRDDQRPRAPGSRGDIGAGPGSARCRYVRGRTGRRRVTRTAAAGSWWDDLFACRSAIAEPRAPRRRKQLTAAG